MRADASGAEDENMDDKNKDEEGDKGNKGAAGADKDEEEADSSGGDDGDDKGYRRGRRRQAEQPMRKHSRSRSMSMRRPSDAAAGAPPDNDGGRWHWPVSAKTRLRNMSEQDRDDLRANVRRVEDRQIHVRDLLRQAPLADPIGVMPEELSREQEMLNRHDLYEQLHLYAEPLPSPWRVVRGIKHKSRDRPEPLLEPVQAWHTRKIHYQKAIEIEMERNKPYEDFPFTKRWPNLQFLDAWPVRELDAEAKTWYASNFGIDPDMKNYVKHMLNMHDGEVRLLGDHYWTALPAGWADWEDTSPTPATGGRQITIYHPNPWHYQYMRNPETRVYFAKRSGSYYKDGGG